MLEREAGPLLPRILSPPCRRGRKPPLRQLSASSLPQRREAPGGAWPGPTGGGGSDRFFLGFPGPLTSLVGPPHPFLRDLSFADRSRETSSRPQVSRGHLINLFLRYRPSTRDRDSGPRGQACHRQRRRGGFQRQLASGPHKNTRGPEAVRTLPVVDWAGRAASLRWDSTARLAVRDLVEMDSLARCTWSRRLPSHIGGAFWPKPWAHKRANPLDDAVHRI